MPPRMDCRAGSQLRWMEDFMPMPSSFSITRYGVAFTHFWPFEHWHLGLAMNTFTQGVFGVKGMCRSDRRDPTEYASVHLSPFVSLWMSFTSVAVVNRFHLHLILNHFSTVYPFLSFLHFLDTLVYEQLKCLPYLLSLSYECEDIQWTHYTVGGDCLS